jgi:hypothetical protein
LRKLVEATLKARPNRVGIYAAVSYAFIVVLVYSYTSFTTKPDNVGLDWIPFVMLAMPWYAINSQFLFPGLIVNAGILFFLGTLVEKVRRRIFQT